MSNTELRKATKDGAKVKQRETGPDLKRIDFDDGTGQKGNKRERVFQGWLVCWGWTGLGWAVD